MKDALMHLIQFTIVVLAIGMMTGLFCHFIDHGWPTPHGGLIPRRAVYPVLFGSYGFMILFAIAEFFAIVYRLASAPSVRQ